MSHSTSRPRGRAPIVSGFTIVELLVVIGIMAILMGLLFPLMGKARESARRAQCLSNVSSIAKAVLAYVHDNNQHVPEASWANTNDGSAPLSPKANDKAPYTTLAPATNKYVLPSIGQVLEIYLLKNGLIWKCPSAPETFYVFRGTPPNDNPFNSYPSNPVEGDGEFVPNYNYMSGKELMSVIPPAAATPADEVKIEWAVRNIGGMKLPQIRSITRQNLTEVVVFHDRSALNHTSGLIDVTDLQPGKTGEYFSCFAFMDGHAEGRSFKDVKSYVEILHKPIKQTWYTVKMEDTMPYKAKYP